VTELAADNPDRVSLSTRDLEDDLDWSDDAVGRQRKYVSVDHALNTLLVYSSATAIDVEAAAIPGEVSATSDPYIIDQAEQARLAEAFRAAAEAAGERDFTVWSLVRVHEEAYRAIEQVSKSEVGRIIGEVDGEIAQALKDRNLWVAGHIREKEHAADVQYQEAA